MGDPQESLQDAIGRLRDATAILVGRREARDANVSPSRPGEDVLKKLDSSMKRNTALIRKLKQLGEESRKALLDDIAKTNQAKYVSEAVSAVAEAPLKIKDISAALQVCSVLHQRYAEFSGELVPALSRILSGSAGGGSEEERTSAARKRTILRLLVELLLCGVYTAHAVLLHIVKQLSVSDFKRDGDAALASLSLMVAFAKAGREELLGLSPADPAALPVDLAERAAAGQADAADCAAALVEYRAELQRRWALAPEAQAQFRGAAEQLFDAACTALQSAHDALGETERENERVLNSRGDLPESLAAAYEAQRSAFEALQRSTAALAEVLERPLPELQAAVTRMAAGAEPSAADSGAADGADAFAPFDDDETKAFYEGLPELRAVVPAVLLGEADGKEGCGDGAVASVDDGEAQGAAEAEEQLRGLKLDEYAAISAVATLPENGIAGGGRRPPSAAAAAAAGGAPAEEEGGSRRALDTVLSRLPTCVSRELCDEVAVEFCYAGGAGKGARRRLARALCEVPHGSLQLLPYYGRVMAVLAPAFPDVAAAVVAHLEAEFAELARRKDATARTLEPRMRNARYIAELLKFRLFPPGSAFSVLKSLLDEFSGHNVDAACALVEAAGRYLSRRPDTATRLTNMLEVMVKLRNARNLDPRQAGLVDSAYFAVRSSGMLPRRRQRPPVREYIRHLVYERLGAASVASVMKRLRRVDWEEEGGYVLRTLLRATRKGRYSQLPLLASLAAGLARYQPALGVGLVDAVMEEIAAGLETPEAALYQRRVAYVRLLGELYSYKLVNSALVFSTLHALLAPPTPPPGAAPEAAQRLDPPTNFFRIRLVCTLLESCGSYFARGAARQRLDDFLPYLERYVLSKPPPLPLDVDLDLQELYTRLKLSPPHYESYTAACAAVAELEAAAASPARALQPIAEEEEEAEEEADEEDMGDAEASDSECSSVSGDEGSSSNEEGEEESEDDSSEVDSEDEDSELDEDEDEEMMLGRGVERSAADDEFDRELAALMGDGAGKAGALGRGGAAGRAALGPATSAASSKGAVAAAAGAETLAFRVMTRRGGKEDRSRELQIPMPAGVAEGLREKEARDAAERAEVKRLVLAADRREAEEEAPGYYGSDGMGGIEGRRRGAGGRGASGYYQRGRSARSLW